MNEMKKIFLVAVLAASAAGAGAQTMYDAINFSRNDYYGTARTMALGNAVTAVGGDLGTIGINPAGSAVAGYGQFTVTPGLSYSVVSSAYSNAGETNFGPLQSSTNSKITMPNIGMSMVCRTGRSVGLKSVTFAVVSNQTAQYNYYANAYGTNSRTSKMAEFASAAAGIDESLLANYNSFENSDIAWDVLTAYQAGMFGSYGRGSNYVGVTEAIGDDYNHYVAGPLSQNSYTSKSGSKNDLVFNLGANISDKVFLGLNIGIPSAKYRYSEYFYEYASNPENFHLYFVGDNGEEYDTYLKGGSYAYQYVSNIDGIYAKIGAIILPFDGLRIGAAFQTPTSYTISESWQYSAAVTFTNSAFNDSQSSPEGQYSYCLRSPYVASFGAAYTFGKAGFVSVDYEITDYSVMKFSEVNPDYMARDIFLDLNETNKYFAGVSHALRIGAELRLTPEFSLRAGYAFQTAPERHWIDNTGTDVTADDYLYDFDAYFSGAKSLVSSSYYGDRTKSISFGAGYSSSGSFFADIAAVVTSYPASLFSPYYDYDNYDANGNAVNVLSPRISNNRSLINVALTLGWRF